jgi:4-amino-4-deoxychorismate lyase
VVIELAQALGIACEEGDLAPVDLLAADELFLTSATRGLIGISRFEERTFPPGPVTHAVREAWNAAIRRKI